MLRVPPSVEVRSRRRTRGSSGQGVARRARIRLRKEPGTVQVGDLFALDHIVAYRHAMETWSSLLLDAGVLDAGPTLR